MYASGQLFKSRDDCCDNGHCRVEPEVKIPNLDACVGRVILGLNEKSWSLTRGQASDCASCERPNVVHHYPKATVSNCFYTGPYGRNRTLVPAALKATVPVIGIHLPSRLLAGHSSCSENASTDYKDDQTGRQIHIREEHAAAVVYASVRRHTINRVPTEEYIRHHICCAVRYACCARSI